MALGSMRSAAMSTGTPSAMIPDATTGRASGIGFKRMHPQDRRRDLPCPTEEFPSRDQWGFLTYVVEARAMTTSDPWLHQ